MSDYTDVVLPYTDLLSAIVPVSSSVRPSSVMSDHTDVALPYTDLLSAIVPVSSSVRPSSVMSDHTDVALPYTDLLSAIVPVSSSVRPSVQRDVRVYRRCLTLHRSSFSHRSCITVLSPSVSPA